MSKLYLITGGSGHLGNTIIKKLIEENQRVRTLILKNDPDTLLFQNNVEVIEGDVCDLNSLDNFFIHESNDEIIVIHCAGIVSISSAFNPNVYNVNVIGTKHIVQKCFENNVSKLVYVSSVHAIPCLPKKQVMSEINYFNSKKVKGLYAKTKAEATQIVLDAAKKGLNATVVHPSGIIGPNDYKNGYLGELLKDYCSGSLKAIINGGYDFCDVRDVSDGIISAAINGKKGECYILSGEYITIPSLIKIFHEITNKKNIKTIIPMWIAKLTAPLAELYYKILKKKPLYTIYSLYTLTCNSNFSNEKAKKDLKYKTRNLKDTIKDTYKWLIKEKKINNNNNC